MSELDEDKFQEIVEGLIKNNSAKKREERTYRMGLSIVEKYKEALKKWYQEQLIGNENKRTDKED